MSSCDKCCVQDARLFLKSTTRVSCSYCPTVMIDKGKKLKLCSEKCTVPGMSWRVLESHNRNEHVDVIVEYDEMVCAFCSNEQSYKVKYEGKYRYDQSKSSRVICYACNMKEIRYNLRNVDQIKCGCSNVLYDCSEYRLILCSTRCTESKWIPEDYINDRASGRGIIFSYQGNTECPACGASMNGQRAEFIGTFPDKSKKTRDTRRGDFFGNGNKKSTDIQHYAHRPVAEKLHSEFLKGKSKTPESLYEQEQKQLEGNALLNNKDLCTVEALKDYSDYVTTKICGEHSENVIISLASDIVDGVKKIPVGTNVTAWGNAARVAIRIEEINPVLSAKIRNIIEERLSISVKS